MMQRELVPFQQTVVKSVSPVEVPAAISAAVLRSFLNGFADTSRVTMRSVLRSAADDMGFALDVSIDELPWHTMTAASLDNALQAWLASTLSKRTIQLYMAAVRGLARALFIRGLLSSEEFNLIKEVKIPRGRNKVGRGRAVERKYRDLLLADCKKDERVHGIRDAALVAILFGSGMRRAEVVSILCENLRLDEGEVIVTVKGGDQVVKYLAGWALPFINDWLTVRNAKLQSQTGPLFCAISKSGKPRKTHLTGGGLYYLLGELSKRANLPFLIRPHDARRTMGTNMLAEHGDTIAQRVLGHANLSTTTIYDKRSDDVIKAVLRNAT